MNLCNRCKGTEPEDDRVLSKVLSEIAHSRARSLSDILRKEELPTLKEKANQYTQARLEENQKKIAEYKQKLTHFQQESSGPPARVINDRMKEELERKIQKLKWQPQEITGKDLEGSLKDYIDLGYLYLEKGEIKITPKGARKLAKQVLRKTLEKLVPTASGSQVMEDIGRGADFLVQSRRYQLGDEYYRLDFERTFLNALERNFSDSKRPGRPFFDIEDFQIYEEKQQSRQVAGLIIDESGSMLGEKMESAIDIGLALSEVLRKKLQDVLKVYLFTHQVREIPYYHIPNVRFSAGAYTDIRNALRIFRRDVANKDGSKQAYLITDTESNTEDGRYIQFEKAMGGVIQEALLYRKAGISLNIIMLDHSPHLKQFASLLARKNLGRVFFASPSELGRVIIENYFSKRRPTI